jgi:hypothetical protein
MPSIKRLRRDVAYAKCMEIHASNEVKIKGDEKNMTGSLICRSLKNEMDWYENRRPYYKVYPCILSTLCKLRLDFQFECPKVPEGVICIRFAEGKEPQTKTGKKISSLLVGTTNVAGKNILLVRPTVGEEYDDQMALPVDTSPAGGKTIQDFIDVLVVLKPGESDADYQKRLLYHEIASLATRIALTVLILDDDPEIITPDVLSDQQDRFDRETDETWKMQARNNATNRGVFGWSIGKNIEVAPHVRRPHWAIRHTGPGKKIPKIVPIKGCKVNWDKLTKVPTGHMMPDGTEVENGKIAS